MQIQPRFLDRVGGPYPTLPFAGSVLVKAPEPVAYRGINRHQNFEEVRHLDELGRKDNPHCLTISASIEGKPQLNLFNQDTLPKEIVDEHFSTLQSPPICIYGLTGHELGGFGLLHSRGIVFYSDDTVPSYFALKMGEASHTLYQSWTRSTFDETAQILEVDFPVAVIFHPNLVYGHFLLEMFPKIYLLSRLRRMGIRFKIASAIELPIWVKAILALYFSEEELLHYSSKTNRVRSPCFIVPSMMQMHYHFHPEFNLAIDEILDFVLRTQNRGEFEKVWLSRSRIARDGNGMWRGIENEDEVEQIVTGLGFTVISPEQLDFPRQISLMAGARCIGGEFGSAMHNSMFATRGAKVFCVNRINWYQSGIGRLRSQPIAYFPPSDGIFRDWRLQGSDGRYRVDCTSLRSQLTEFVDYG